MLIVGAETVRVPPAVVLTVKVVLALILPDVAVMVVGPVLVVAVARPALLIVAMVGEDDVQLTVAVTSCVLPLPSVPVAVNCCVLPVWIVEFEGESEIATREFPDGKNWPQAAIASAAQISTTDLQMRDKFKRTDCPSRQPRAA